MCTTAEDEGDVRRLLNRSFQGDASVVVLFVLCFGVEFLCCLNRMYVFIFLFKFG